jgi:hypothetical protein
MIARQRPLGFMAVMALTLALVLGPGFTGVAGAASEDVAMFYDDLSQHGQWVEVEKYGPVWQPSKVSEDWRPYTDGRWVPTDDGNVFESEEPWGWATYHYGNWMPTEANGWVWVPGRTWYPSTVEWRASPETEPVETSYVGWAPTPPPNYEPPPSYAPASYYQGSPVTDSLSSPQWIFARAAQFLLGFGQPYTPAYSYATSGILMPPAYVPVFYSRTAFIPAYATPTYYPPAFFGGRRFGSGYYNMGPSAAYFSRVTNTNQADINRIITRNSANITRIHNVVPPHGVINRHGYVKQIIPPALIQGQRLPPPRLAPDVKLAQINLNRPNFVPPPRNVPRITATIPRVQPAGLQPGSGLPGTALPSRATMPLTPQMTQQIQQLPPKQQFVPGRAQPFTPAAVQTGPGQVQPGVPAPPGQVQPGIQPKPGQFQPGVPAQPARVQPGVPGKPGQIQPGPPAKPGQVQPGAPPAGPAKPGEFHPGVRPGTPTTQATPRAAPPGTAPLPTGAKGLAPEQRRHQEGEPQRLQRGVTSGQPQAQPQRPPKAQPQGPSRTEPQAKPQAPSRVQPQVQPRSQPQMQPRSQPQVQPQASPRVQPQVQPRQQPQPQTQVQPRSQPQPQSRPQVAPRPQPQPRSQPQPQAQPEKKEERKK